MANGMRLTLVSGATIFAHQLKQKAEELLPAHNNNNSNNYNHNNKI